MTGCLVAQSFWHGRLATMYLECGPHSTRGPTQTANLPQSLWGRVASFIGVPHASVHGITSSWLGGGMFGSMWTLWRATTCYIQQMCESIYHVSSSWRVGCSPQVLSWASPVLLAPLFLLELPWHVTAWLSSCSPQLQVLTFDRIVIHSSLILISLSLRCCIQVHNNRWSCAKR